MKTKIKLTGPVAKILNRKYLDAELPLIVSEFIEELTSQNPELATLRICLSSDGIICESDHVLKTGSKILLFSPFSGG